MANKPALKKQSMLNFIDWIREKSSVSLEQAINHPFFNGKERDQVAKKLYNLCYKGQLKKVGEMYKVKHREARINPIYDNYNGNF
jgi:hypothetical protein